MFFILNIFVYIYIYIYTHKNIKNKKHFKCIYIYDKLVLTFIDIFIFFDLSLIIFINFC